MTEALVPFVAEVLERDMNMRVALPTINALKVNAVEVFDARVETVELLMETLKPPELLMFILAS